MPTSVDLGFFSRAGAAMAGTIGPLRATWDRHHGGVQTIDGRGVSVGPVRLAARVRVVKAGRAILLRQEADPDPRLIVAEQGPERIWMRVMFSLLDERGGYHGDGLTDTILYADGEVRLALAVRLVDAAAQKAVTDAWIEMELAGQAASGSVGTGRPTALDLSKPTSYSFRRGLPGRFVAVAGRAGGIAAGYYSLDGRAEDKLGGVGLWHGPGDRAPWYDTWGHLYEQWHGLSGWGGHKTGRLVIEPGEGHQRPKVERRESKAQSAAGSRAMRLNWHWLAGAHEPTGANFGCKALLAIYFDRDAKAALKRLQASFAPVVPKVNANEAQFRCLDVLENTLVYRSEWPLISWEFPRNGAGRRARIRLFGVYDNGPYQLEINANPAQVQVLAAGGMTDDPYGPNLARPGDRFAPLIGDVNSRFGEAVFSAELMGRRATRVTWGSQQLGFSLAYLKWDDRQIYLIRDDFVDDAWPLATFSAQTLCVHDLRARSFHYGAADGGDPVRRPSTPPPAVVRLPLYWYPANVQTRGHCANELRRISVGNSVDGELTLSVESANPNGDLHSRVVAEWASWQIDTVLNVSAVLDVLRPFDLPEIQFLNVFPYNSWRPANWETDWVVTLDEAGRETTYFVKESLGGRRVGDPAADWRRAFFLAQGARDRGNIFVLARAPKGVRQNHRYALCGVWLDSHFSVVGLKPPVKAGTKLAMDYTLAVVGDKRLSRAAALEIGRRSIKSGRLSF